MVPPSEVLRNRMVAHMATSRNRPVAYIMRPMQIERRITLPVRPEEAWRAILDFSSWFCDEHSMERVTPGARAEFRWAGGVSRAAVFEDVDAPRALAFRWLPFERDASGAPSSRPQTRVEISLEACQEGTDIVIVERRLDDARTKVTA